MARREWEARAKCFDYRKLQEMPDPFLNEMTWDLAKCIKKKERV